MSKLGPIRSAAFVSLVSASAWACSSDVSGPALEANELASELRGPGPILLEGSELIIASADPRGSLQAIARGGGDVRELDEVGGIEHFEVTDGYIYYVQQGDALRRLIRSGGDSASIALRETQDFVVVGERVFATSADANELWTVRNSGGAISAVDGVEAEAPRGIVANGSELFWMHGDSQVHKGAVPEPAEAMSPSLAFSFEGTASGALHLFGSSLVFDVAMSTDQVEGPVAIYRAATDAQDASIVADGAITRYTLSGDYLYYSLEASESGDEAGIYRLDLASEDADSEFLLALDVEVGGLAADDERVYWSEPGFGRVQSAELLTE